MLTTILRELKQHAPFTALGALIGIACVGLLLHLAPSTAYTAFYILHPLHVLLSALVAGSMYRLHTHKKSLWLFLLVGYGASVGVATLSDSLIPYISEVFMNLPNRELHLGFVEEWWLVNPIALLGLFAAYRFPSTHVRHSAHVLVSTFASLLHIVMALGGAPVPYVLITAFLFISVWIPCCTGDIVVPLLFTGNAKHVCSGSCASHNH
jgi:hypothetical protein